ncbi:MAG: DEAD/DEAH box helicase, partial [Chlamydiales bacterium]|nr:DEAD/DEAH box helicase [Chlamydiales bacterium]
PIHVRFRNSLWNRLAQMACRRHGPGTSILTRSKKGWDLFSATKKKLFSVEGLTGEGRARLEEILLHRPEETEETSLKFSNLPQEEISLLKKGKVSQKLAYELSFWSDLAKWWMQLQDGKEAYKVSFCNLVLPKWIYAQFSEVGFSFYVAEANWPLLIDALATVKSPLPVYEISHEEIESIRYEPSDRSFVLDVADSSGAQMKLEEMAEFKNHKAFGDWIFIPEKGFFSARFDPIFSAKQIPAHKVGVVLQKHSRIIQNYLGGTDIHLESYQARYEVFLDAAFALHIRCYVFEEGDLDLPLSHFFGPWVFIEKKGFYLLEGLLFDGAEKVIAKENLSDFIDSHRVFLNGYEGFQTHILSIESQLAFRLTPEGVLQFESDLQMAEEGTGELVDFGKWLYLKGKGFFLKKEGKAGSGIHPGKVVYRPAISDFIRTHQEELEGIKGFFSSNPCIEKCGLDLFLNSDQRIVVRPYFHFLPAYRGMDVQVFGDYTYVPHEGFAQIPGSLRLPDGYEREKTIPLSEEPHFVAYELDFLSPYITSIQKPLQKIKELGVRVKKMTPVAKMGKKQWLVEIAYETSLGEIDLYSVWEGLQQHRKYLFTPSGLIFLKHPRFNWLKGIEKRRWKNGNKVLRLTTMDWIRLFSFDQIKPPQEKGATAEKTRSWMEQLQNFETDLPLDLSGFTSSLRSYQQTGVKWLWFLYHYGLSALLCDEMGLGKTHQA